MDHDRIIVYVLRCVQVLRRVHAVVKRPPAAVCHHTAASPHLTPARHQDTTAHTEAGGHTASQMDPELLAYFLSLFF